MGAGLLMSMPVFSQFRPLQAEGETGVKVFNHLDLGVELGTTGVGVELASPVGNYLQLRAGFTVMPRFSYPMHFHVQVGEQQESKYDAQGNRVETKFDRLAAKLEQYTGYRADDDVEMTGVPTYYNMNVMLDVFPLKNNKHWRLTAGFYAGPKKIAKAYNVTEAMPSLLAVGIYNRIYEKVDRGEPIYENMYLPMEMEDKILGYGRMGIHVGDYVDDVMGVDDEGNPVVVHEKGSPYMMEPGEDGMVKASVTVNSFKPYVGLGYEGRLVRGNDRLKLAVDGGVMFWGGMPKILTHDGTDLARDVENISGKVGTYADIVKTFKVFPVLNLKLAYRLF